MKIRVLITFFVLSTQVGFAQLSEVGVMVGTTYYLGDLNRTHFKNPKFSIGILFRRSISDRVAFRLNFLYGNVSGADSESDDPFRANRNLSFKSSIAELGGIFEFNYYTYNPGDKKNRFTTYLLIGFSYFRMNPKGQLNGTYYELNAIGTEGQGFPDGPNRYKLDAFAIPIGLGAKFNVGKRMAISLEYSLRFTFTDYLDDVSDTYYATDAFGFTPDGERTIAGQLADRRLEPNAPTQDADGNTLGLQRGNNSTNDWYGFAGVFLSFRIGKELSTCANWN